MKVWNRIKLFVLNERMSALVIERSEACDNLRDNPILSSVLKKMDGERDVIAATIAKIYESELPK